MTRTKFNVASSHCPTNHALYYSRDAIVLATISALVVQFTDLSGSLDTDSASWIIVLWLTSINPSTISRLWQVLVMIPSSFPKASKCGVRDSDSQQGAMSRKQKRFICHEVLHTITGFYHYYPLQGLVWMAMINFPLWFAHLDLCMREKEDELVLQVSSSSPRKDMSSKRKIDRFEKQSHLLAQRDPLVVFSLAIYMFGVFFRGPSFLLSGAGVVIMSLPFTRRKVAFSVAATVPPLVILFFLEHYTIMNEMDTWHNVVHSLSHITLHMAVNSLFKHHVA